MVETWLNIVVLLCGACGLTLAVRWFAGPV